MIENQAKEELIDMKVEPKQGSKSRRRISRVCLGVEVHLGIEITRLGEPVISMKTLEDSSRVRLGEPSLALA